MLARYWRNRHPTCTFVVGSCEASSRSPSCASLAASLSRSRICAIWSRFVHVALGAATSATPSLAYASLALSSVAFHSCIFP